LGLASNSNPPDLYLPRTWDYRCEPLVPILFFSFPYYKPVCLPELPSETQYPKIILGVAEGEEVFLFCICFEAGKVQQTLPTREIVSPISFPWDWLSNQIAPAV
jgi:hypothetical protein